MTVRCWVAWACLPLLAALLVPSAFAPACCPAPQVGRFVVNADQTVIMVWNPETKTQHFIRQASFKSDGEDLGFIVPTPSEPELAESGNGAFRTIAEFTKPEVRHVNSERPQHMNCACSSETRATKTATTVQVLQEKRVAGFDAVVLEATSAHDLVDWLIRHGYEFSPEVAVWAEPYIEQGWKFTALQVAKDNEQQEQVEVSASALRLTFQTEQPLFPYREPDMTAHAEKLEANSRLLRIYFLADKRYDGQLTKESPWTGQVVWSDKLQEHQCQELQRQLALLGDNFPRTWWLTEFEDNWPYRPAPADLYFAASTDQRTVHRPPIFVETAGRAPLDAMPLVIAVALVAPACWHGLRRR